MKAVRIREYGGVEVLRWEESDIPTPRPHQVLIKVESSGVNYADIMRRQGNYPGPDLPATLGLEAAGIIEQIGSDVSSSLEVGQRVMGMGPQGNAEYVAINANLVFPYPSNIDPQIAGGMPIAFLTAYHLLRSRGQVQKGDNILIQAGASGVGTIATQMAHAWGAKVITTASTTDKLELSKSLGADETINYTEQDFEKSVMELTEGKGVQLILECVGGQILEKSIRCLAPYGQLISYGNASGITANIPSTDFTSANRRITGFSMGRSPVGTLDHESAMKELTPMIEAGSLKLIVDRIQPMSEVAKAHQHLSDRGTRGKVILIP
ncbi:MAG: hypothetical protein CL886_05740 [Dehalococcoidia bacterium]|nr:hypothetical protein [Dehalococcoidia bacterium]|tara:strand:- start:22 stop:990 length:969 start_codon:yes stop_codon:yes gene_type:complete